MLRAGELKKLLDILSNLKENIFWSLGKIKNYILNSNRFLKSPNYLIKVFFSSSERTAFSYHFISYLIKKNLK